MIPAGAGTRRPPNHATRPSAGQGKKSNASAPPPAAPLARESLLLLFSKQGCYFSDRHFSIGHFCFATESCLLLSSFLSAIKSQMTE